MPAPAKNPASGAVPPRDAGAPEWTAMSLACDRRLATTASPPASTSAARIAASPASKPQLRMSSAPVPVEPLAFPSASPAPAPPSHSGALSRRVLLAGGVTAALFPLSGFAEETILEAVKLPGGGVGYGGASPGPTLRCYYAKPVQLTLVNRLDVPAPFSWVGLRLPGPPVEPLAPGERRAVTFTPREAGFGLYGAFGSPDLWAGGLFGPVFVENLGSRPPDSDMTVVFSGADAATLRADAGPGPLRLDAAEGERVRLRFANASPETFVALVARQPVQVVAIDGQPCEMFQPNGGALPLAPTARFEVLFDVSDQPTEFVLAGARDAIVRIVPSGEGQRPGPPIAPLHPNTDLPAAIALERALRVKVAMTGVGPYAIAGAKPLFRAARGQPVVVTLTNQTPTPQTLRLEGHCARILHALDDGWDPYWRDTLYLEPGRKLLAAFVADNPGLWPLASASPERRAKGLATWFVVS